MLTATRLSDVVAFQRRDPLRDHLVGGRPLTQAPRIAAAEREELPVTSDYGGVFETACQLRVRARTW